MDLNLINITSLPQDARAATKHLLDTILKKIRPLLIKIRSRNHCWSEEGHNSNFGNVYTLCLSQIKKCILNLFEVFRLEFNSHILLQETRQCNLERLSWCYNKLVAIYNYLENQTQDNTNCSEESNDSFNATVMYFVNWIDHAFEILSKLAEAAYKTDYKENEQLCEQWKYDIVECISGLHVSIDELLLSAMTLCRYCLPNDQLIVKARCQVVLRETKALFSELIVGDLSSTVNAKTETLKLPIMPSNVNVMIDVLKDVLYVLETNTNTALLTLLVHCFSNNTSPVQVLREHFANANRVCSCVEKGTESHVMEDCQFVKDFDLYNERLLQIGSFAVSCSSDNNRILLLRSGLASLEALDPHLVPALMTSPGGLHATLLIKTWKQEVQDIRDSVFLIVDPAAFADKSKQMIHQKLLEALGDATYNNANVCSVINTGCVVHDFFHVYMEIEPNALSQQEKLLPFLADLNKVQIECKVVSNLLSAPEDFTYDVKTPAHKEATLDQLHKRLKLLYTIITRINTLLQPKDNDQFDEEEIQLKNVTHTILKNGKTYLNSPRKPNLTRSMFARTNTRSSTRNIPSKLTKRLTKNCSQLNFSVELDKLFNLSKEKSEDGTFIKHKLLDRVRETSALYNFSPIKNRSSMRKIVLNRHRATFDKVDDEAFLSEGVKESLMDETESLQLTEVLTRLNDMTTITTNRRGAFQSKTKGESNILSININNQNATVSKNIWNIPVTSEELHETMMTSSSNITQPSNVTTMERISDLDLVENKLNNLKFQCETSL